MGTQLEFTEDVTGQDPNLGRLVYLLEARPAWHHASELLGLLGLEDGESGRRYVRRLASAAEPEVISGQRGYKHIRHATREEGRHFAAAMDSQSEKMHARAKAARRRLRELLGEETDGRAV